MLYKGHGAWRSGNILAREARGYEKGVTGANRGFRKEALEKGEIVEVDYWLQFGSIRHV